MQMGNNSWYHVTCMAMNSLLIPERFIKILAESISIDPVYFKEHANQLECSICCKSDGLVYPCGNFRVERDSESTSEGMSSNCQLAFHPLCAYLVNF